MSVTEKQTTYKCIFYKGLRMMNILGNSRLFVRLRLKVMQKVLSALKLAEGGISVIDRFMAKKPPYSVGLQEDTNNKQKNT